MTNQNSNDVTHKLNLPPDPPVDQRTSAESSTGLFATPHYDLPTKAPATMGVGGQVQPTLGSLVQVQDILHYAKIIGYVIIAVLGTIITGLQLHTDVWHLVLAVVITLAGAVVVYVVPNVGAGVGGYLKLIMAALAAAAQVLVPLATFHTITGAEWLSAAVAAFAALGVYVLPNSPQFKYQLAA